MTLRFRQSFMLFPGVRINVGKNGISTSLGVPGATVNVGRQGVRATIGLPGTGLSYSTLLVPSGQPRAADVAYDPAPAYWTNPRSVPAELPGQGMREISSATTERLSSASLLEMRDMIASARAQKKLVDGDLRDARDELAKQTQELSRRKNSLFRFFYKRRIGELEAEVPTITAEIERLEGWKETTKIVVDFETGETAHGAYADLVRAFDKLRMCRKKWDVTSDRG